MALGGFGVSFVDSASASFAVGFALSSVQYARYVFATSSSVTRCPTLV